MGASSRAMRSISSLSTRYRISSCQRWSSQHSWSAVAISGEMRSRFAADWTRIESLISQDVNAARPGGAGSRDLLLVAPSFSIRGPDGAARLRRPARQDVGAQTFAPPLVPDPRDHRASCPSAGPAPFGPVDLGWERPGRARPPCPGCPPPLGSFRGPSMTDLPEDPWHWTPDHRDRHAADRHTRRPESACKHRQRRRASWLTDPMKDGGQLL